LTAFTLVCPRTGAALREVDGALVSDRGDSYPIVEGVAVIVQGVSVKPRSAPLAPHVIDQLMNALGLHPSRRTVIEQAFAQEFSFEEDWIQTEADQFLGRVAASHEGLFRALALDSEDQPVPTEVNLAPSIELTTMFDIRRLNPATSFSVNVRVENLGTSTLSSEGAQPFLLAYHWIDGEGVEREGKRTPMFDDLPPGRSMTIPVFIDAPPEPGRQRLRIRGLQEYVGWFDVSSIEHDVDIVGGAQTVDDPSWRRSGNRFDYNGDHFEAVRLLGLWRDTLFDRPVDRVVEIGGNANPMIDHFGMPEKYNVDVDPYGMIVGKLIRYGMDSTVKFIVANGMALPMPPRSIDMLVMFATFHHFPQPVELLSRLKDYVADDGLICLLCEPIGHVHRDLIEDDYLQEIRKGVNEQSFELWEYQQMFEAAKLDVVAAQIDVGSIKFALRPRRD
jgi:SAM-dependent methyltransferase